MTDIAPIPHATVDTGDIQPILTRPHPAGVGVQKLYRFPNGYGASVACFAVIPGLPVSYSSPDEPWELMPVRWTSDDDYILADDPVGWLNDQGVQQQLHEISNWTPKPAPEPALPLAVEGA